MAPGVHNTSDPRAIEAKIKTLINNDLKEICRGENLPVSGTKAVLQGRIIHHLHAILQRHDARDFARLGYRVNNRGESPPPDTLAAATNRSTSTPMSPALNRPMVSSYSRPGLSAPGNRTNGYTVRMNFKPSPFYQILEELIPQKDLTEMPQNRNTINFSLTLSHGVCERLRADSTLRVMMYGAASIGLGPFNVSDIAFPGQVEVKVNGDEVRANFKGLKKKDGTTKPADVTDLIRKAPGYQNSFQIVYALTNKRYSVVVNLVKKTSPEQLAEKLKTGKKILKEDVVREMVSKAKDPDIVATSTVMSLKDPISTMRMTIPCRSTVCSHNQCFDGLYFLQLQEQAPTWTCPVCNKIISYEALCVDEYVQDILQKTTKQTEQITIEPTGSWHATEQHDDSSNSRGGVQARAAYDNDSDDDVIEIQDAAPSEVKAEGQSATPAIVRQSSPISSREASTAAASSTPAARTSSKRPSAVIDLTLSDDDEPPRPAKRPHTSQSTSTSYSASGSSIPGSRSGDLSFRNVGSHAHSYLHGRPLLPPIQQSGQTNGGVPDGQRLPWPVGAPTWSSNYRDNNSNGSYSHSPT